MLLAEPTSGVVWNANRGAISLRVRVFGKSAHVGLQHQGANAFERMHLVVERLEQLKREVEQRKTRCNVGAEQMRNSILMLGGLSGGGANFNVVPEQCWFTIDRRINPEEDLDEEKAKLLGVLEQCKRDGIPLEWDVLQEGRSAACAAKTKRWVKRSPAACKRDRRSTPPLKCVLACWKLASMRRGDTGIRLRSGTPFGRAWAERIR